MTDPALLAIIIGTTVCALVVHGLQRKRLPADVPLSRISFAGVTLTVAGVVLTLVGYFAALGLRNTELPRYLAYIAILLGLSGSLTGLLTTLASYVITMDLHTPTTPRSHALSRLISRLTRASLTLLRGFAAALLKAVISLLAHSRSTRLYVVDRDGRVPSPFALMDLGDGRIAPYTIRKGDVLPNPFDDPINR